jgi:hypothetical protein
MTKPLCPFPEKQVAAAFVALYDYALAGLSLQVPFELIETIGYSMRCSITLSRAEAQALLEEHQGAANVAAALVLVYEGVGLHRAEPEYYFCLNDLYALDRTRRSIALSLRQALALLT